MKKRMISMVMALLLTFSVCMANGMDAFAAEWKKDANGWWLQEEGGYPTSDWRSVNGHWYYFDANGYVVTGWNVIDGAWYYMDANGAMVSNSWVGDYYLGSNGAMVTNAWVNGYYVGSDGCWIRDRWVQGTRWWYRYGDGTYPVNTWKAIDGKWYFFDTSGYMVTGWYAVGDAWYYMDASGAMVSNSWVGDYYLGPDGAMMTNAWVDGYLVGPDGCWIRNINMYEGAVLELVNAEREARGLAPLYFATDVADAADIRAYEISQKFSHERPDGRSCFSVLDDFGIDCAGMGENIARGYQTPEAVVNGWMNSEGHRANILGNFDFIAIGCYQDGRGVLSWVQLFLKSW